MMFINQKFRAYFFLTNHRSLSPQNDFYKYGQVPLLFKEHTLSVFKTLVPSPGSPINFLLANPLRLIRRIEYTWDLYSTPIKSSECVSPPPFHSYLNAKRLAIGPDFRQCEADKPSGLSRSTSRKDGLIRGFSVLKGLKMGVATSILQVFKCKKAHNQARFSLARRRKTFRFFKERQSERWSNCEPFCFKEL